MLPRRKRPAHALIAALAGLVLVAYPAVSQQPAVQSEGTALVTEIGGHRVTFPVPRWLDEGEGAEAPFVFNRLAADVESLIFVPKGETVVSWTRMMGVLVVNRIGYGSNTQLASVIQPLQESCTRDQLGLTPVKSRRAGQPDAVILVCGRYRPSSAAPTGCAAGIIVAVVRESWNGAMKVYDEWCTGAFNLESPEGWPVSSTELMALAKAMQDITAFEALAKSP
jgi:hypothetical protein